jgi:hypothetical protein
MLAGLGDGADRYVTAAWAIAYEGLGDVVLRERQEKMRLRGELEDLRLMWSARNVARRGASL